MCSALDICCLGVLITLLSQSQAVIQELAAVLRHSQKAFNETHCTCRGEPNAESQA